MPTPLLLRAITVAVIIFAANNKCIAQAIEIVSKDSAGIQGNDESIASSISDDGHFIVFSSKATNLVSGDSNGRSDIFLRDNWTGKTTRLSESTIGVEANHWSNNPSISADGRYIAFDSQASNLVSDDIGWAKDIFVRDQQTSDLIRISVNFHGEQGDSSSWEPSISADGRYVVFTSSANNLSPWDQSADDIFLHDRVTGLIEQISTSSLGAPGNHHSSQPSISADGRFVAFSSWADNLVPADTNLSYDIFVKDRATGITQRVSVDSFGNEGDLNCQDPIISANGRFVAFRSSSTNLVPGDTNGTYDIFVHDRKTAITELVSKDSNGVLGNSNSYAPDLSADGRFVVFHSISTNLVIGDTNWKDDIFVHDRLTATTERWSTDALGAEGNHFSRNPSISADGSRITFESYSDNLVPGDVNPSWDIFLKHLPNSSTHDTIQLAGQFLLQVGSSASLSWFGAPPNSNYWLAYSRNANGSNLYGHDFDLGFPLNVLATGVNSPTGTGNFSSAQVPFNAAGLSIFIELAALDGSGNYFDSTLKTLTFTDTSVGPNTKKLSVDSNEIAASHNSRHPDITGDGRFVAFSSIADNLVAGDDNGFYDIYLRDRLTGITERVSLGMNGEEPNAWCDWPSVSSDGRFIAFSSSATNLVSTDPFNYSDVFVHDRQTGITEVVSVDSFGTQYQGDSYRPSISADGNVVAFISWSNELVPGDNNWRADAFTHDRQTGVTEIVSVDSNGVSGNSHNDYAVISANGRFVAFASGSSNLVANDNNSVGDVFVHDRQTGIVERVSVDSFGNEANLSSYYELSISGDGRFVAFTSFADNLAPNDTNGVQDIFLHDRQTGTTDLSSADSFGVQGNAYSYGSAISEDGNHIAFYSIADNLVINDTNMWGDTFIHHRLTGVTERASLGSFNEQGNRWSDLYSAVSADGKYVAFSSVSNNLVLNDVGDWMDVFVHTVQ